MKPGVIHILDFQANNFLPYFSDSVGGFLENVRNKACEILKSKEFTSVNNCFQDKRNVDPGIL